MDKLYRLAYRFCGSAADAEDLLQEVLIKAYARRRELSSIGALGPWLSRVLYNRFIDHTRRYARERLKSVSLDEQIDHLGDFAGIASPERGPQDCAEAGFDIKRLTAALEQLSIDHRTVLLMHDAEGYKIDEIQLITGVASGTLKSRLHRARERLRDLLGDDGTF